MKSIQNNEKQLRAAFHPYLHKLSTAAWLLKLLPIPIGLWTASLLSALITSAVSADLSAVLVSGTTVISVLCMQKLFDILTGTAYQKALLLETQNCRQILYRRFLASPLHRLFTARHGEIMEHFYEDFQTAVNRTTNLIPSFWCAVMQTIAYFLYLAFRNPWIALILLGLSAFQLFPPLIVKKFMERNYTDCCELDEVILDYTMQAYHGFATIRLYGLKNWWQKGMKKLHRTYMRIGNRSTITGTAENTMNSLVDHVLRYGTYGILGVLVLTETAAMDTALEAVALSGGFFGAVKTAAGAIPAFAVARKAEERLALWFAEVPEPSADSVCTTDIFVEKLSCAPGEQKIFTDLTAALDLSKITLLKGENGTGKTTLMRLLAGLMLPDAGSVCTGGASPEGFGEDTYPGKLFYLPQEDAVYHITPMELYRMILPEDVPKAVSVAVRFGLTEEQLTESYIDTLSGGERKKVYLSLALALDPVLLLLDEPANSLDDAGRKELCTLLQERKSGALIVTHDPFLDDISDHIAMLYKGGIRYEK